MKFVAVDVETANSDMASICAIGIAQFERGQLVDEYYSLINPDDHFYPINMSIHGIDAAMIDEAPSFEAAGHDIFSRLHEAIVATHTHFDRVAILKAAQRWRIEPPRCRWLDTAKVARRTWPDCARSGYGLGALCERLGIALLRHHHALDDAKAAGQILLAAMTESGLNLEEVLQLTSKPIISSHTTPIRLTGNPDGPLFGEVAVFTGTLAMPRSEAAQLAAQTGCEVASTVTKRTSILIVGDTDLKRLSGHSKSSKHRKAEYLISQGFPIRIISETDFRYMLSIYYTCGSDA